MKPVTEQIRDAILASGMRNSELSAATGIAQATLCRFMAGKGGLSMEGLDALGRVLGLSVTIQKRGKTR